MILNRIFKLSSTKSLCRPLSTLVQRKPVKDAEVSRDEVVDLVNYVNNKLKEREDKNDQVDFWNQLKQHRQIIKLGLTPTNFENRFLNLIYDFKLTDNELILNSLKDYYLDQRIHQNVVRKCAYGQLLLMLKDDNYDKEIESTLQSLIDEKIISETICVNFIFAYARSSRQRFNRIYPLLDEFDFKNFVKYYDFTKLIELMDVAFEHKEYEKFFAMFRLLYLCPKQAAEHFRSKADSIQSEQLFLKFLSALNSSRAGLMTEDIDYVTNRLARFNFRPSKIEPKNSRCPNCEQEIAGITQDELKQLEEYFLDIFKKEINRQRNEKVKRKLYNYINFLYEYRNQFDLIIDGLNASFQGKMKYDLIRKEKSGGIDLVTKSEFFETNLINSIKVINKDKKYKKILLIGRYSQLKQKGLSKYMEENRICFKPFDKFVEDDLAVILAGVFNFNCRLITNDFFNDHLHRIQDEKLVRLFRKFMGCYYATANRKNLKLDYHNEGWDKIIHINDETTKHTKIHIPFNTDNVNYKHIFSWFCFTKQS